MYYKVGGKVNYKVYRKVIFKMDGKVNYKVDNNVNYRVDGKVKYNVDEKLDGKVDGEMGVQRLTMSSMRSLSAVKASTAARGMTVVMKLSDEI